MWLIVGLGNPGTQYALTRHNIGFMAVDLLAQGFGASWSQEHKALTAKITINGEKALLAKPQTYMNRSGESVQSLMQFYKIDADHLIVLHDEVDLPFETLKIHRNKSAGGNNGIKDIHEKMATQDYVRIRLGIGRPPHPQMAMADYVLQKFAQEEQTLMADYLNRAGDAVEALIKNGYAKASTQFNSSKESK